MEEPQPKDLAEQIEQDRKAIAELQKKVNDLVARRKANVEELRKRDLESLHRRIEESKKEPPPK